MSAAVAQGVDGPGQIIRQYALHFAAGAPSLALEYCMLAARARGDDKETRTWLLQELLTEPNVFSFLLGHGTSRGGESLLDRSR